MISKESLQYIITKWLQSKIDEYDSPGYRYDYSLMFGLNWHMSIGFGVRDRHIGAHLHYGDKHVVIGYDIWTYDRSNINISIREGVIEFIEDSEFLDFTKEDMKDLYNKIKNTRIIKYVLNEEDIK